MVFCAAYAFELRADPPATLAECQEYAQARVFSLRTDRAAGTAVLLKVEDKAADERFGYFVACYHVLHGATSFDIYPIGKGNSVASHTGSSVFARRTQDLVILKARLRGGPSYEALAPLEPDGMASTNDKEGIEGFAFGAAGFQSRSLFPSRVRLQEIRPAYVLKDVIDSVNGREEAGVEPMEVRFLGNEITYGGMSGGLVIDNHKRFGGLLLGRMPEPNAIPVMLTARQVKALFDASLKAPGQAFDAKLFKAPPPYREAVVKQMQEPWTVNEISWTSYEAWLKAFDSNPLRFLESFQEINLDLKLLQAFAHGKASERLSVEANEDTGRVRVLLNGKPYDPKEPGLLPGENLLIISKVPGGRGLGFELTDFLKPDTIDVSLRLGDSAKETVYQIRRSLPQIIQGYSIYVTIRNGPAAPETGYAARLAVSVDYLEELLNNVPFKLPVGDREARTGTEYAGYATLDVSNHPVRLSYVSPQTLDVFAQVQLVAETLKVSFAGVNMEAPRRAMTLDMKGRVQCPIAADPDSLFFLCARAMGASGPDRQFLLPVLGQEITVDASGLLRQLLVCYANNQLLHPDDPKMPGRGQIREFFKSGGLFSGADGWSWEPTRIFLERPEGSAKAWAIVTFRLLKDGEPITAESPPPLLPEPADRDRLAAEFLVTDFATVGLKTLHPSITSSSLEKFLAANGEGQGTTAKRLRVALPRPAKVARRSPIVLTGKAIGLTDELGKLITEGMKAAPIEGELDWGLIAPKGGPTFEGIHLTVSHTLDRADRPTIDGKLRVAKAKIDEYALTDVQADFKLSVDPASEEKAYLFDLHPTEGLWANGKGDGGKLPKSAAISVWISRDGKRVKTDLRGLADGILFGNPAR